MHAQPLPFPGDNNKPPSVTDLQARDEWVNAQLIRTFMRYAGPAQRSASISIMATVAILYGHVSMVGLGFWTLASVAVTLVRYRVIDRYQREFSGVSGAPLEAFMSRYSWAWTLSAIVWGASMFLFFLKAPVYVQFVCMIMLASMAAFAVGIFSSCLSCFTGYLNGMAYTALLAMIYQLVMARGVPSGFNIYAMVLLVLVYWSVVRVAGRRFHEVQRATLEQQFANAELIASLTEKSRAALEAVETKNRFLASAAHDLRQPVHALGLYADWLQSEPQLVEQIAPKIVQSTKAVNELFNSLFDLARLDSEALQINWQPVDLARLVDELELQYAPLALQKGLTLRTHVLPAALAWSDPVLLKRLVGNLLSNAVRNTLRGGVLLAVRPSGAGWRIEVWDSGVGIAPEHQQAVFQEFYRVTLHEGTEDGFGLGLAIVARLSVALAHPVSLSSRLGRGTVFRLELPAVKDQAAAA